MYISVVLKEACPDLCLIFSGSSPRTAIDVIPVARRSCHVSGLRVGEPFKGAPNVSFRVALAVAFFDPVTPEP
jgi:hypothetical protein